MPPRVLRSCVYVSLPTGLATSLAQIQSSAFARISARHFVFGKRGLVEDADFFAHMPVLVADRAEPVLPAHGINVFGLGARLERTSSAAPSRAWSRTRRGAALAGHRAARRCVAVPRHTPHAESRSCSACHRPSSVRSLTHCPVAVQAGKPPDVDDPQVERRLAVDHPLRQHPAGAAARRDAEGVEAGADEHIGAFRRDTEDEIAVRGKTLRPVDHLLDADILQRRHARDGLGHMLFEMIVVVIEQAELPLVRDIAAGQAGRPGLRVRLVAAHHQPADLFLRNRYGGRGRGSSARRSPARRSSR